MSFTFSPRTLVHRVSRLTRRGCRQAGRDKPTRFRPRLEACEDRTLLDTVQWVNPACGFWHVGSNWDRGTPPGLNDDAIIPALPSTCAVIHSQGTDVIHSLTSDTALVVSGGSLSLATASTINNNLVFSAGEIMGAGDLTINGRFTWTGGTLGGLATATTTANGGMVLNGFGVTLQGRRLNNAGISTLSGPSASLSLSSATFTNLAGAVFDIRNDQGIFGSTNDRFINQAGATLRRSLGRNAAFVQAPLDNAGTVEVLTGTLALSGDGNHAGTFTGAPGTTLQFSGGSHNLQPASAIAAARVLFSGGTVNINGTYDAGESTTLSAGDVTFNPVATLTALGAELVVSGGTLNLNSGEALSTTALTLSGGTLTGSDDLTVDGLFRWTGGTLSGAGRTTANGGIEISGFDVTLGRRLDNAGTVTWAGPSSSIFAASSAVFNNLAGATFDVQNDQSFFSGCMAVFNNAGAFRKRDSYGTTTIDVVFNNTGTVEVQTGIVDFRCGAGPGRGSAAGGGEGRFFADGPTRSLAEATSHPTLAEGPKAFTVPGFTGGGLRVGWLAEGRLPVPGGVESVPDRFPPGALGDAPYQPDSRQVDAFFRLFGDHSQHRGVDRNSTPLAEEIAALSWE